MMRCSLPSLLTSALLMAVAVGPATAETAIEARLDQLQHAGKLGELRLALDAVQPTDIAAMDRSLEWLRAGFAEHGQGAVIGYLYAVQLYRASAVLTGAKREVVQQAADVIATATGWVIQTEGFQCVDPDAAGNRLAMLKGGIAHIDRHFQSLSPGLRADVLKSAFGLLRRHHAQHVDDPWLCAGGPRYAAAYQARYGRPIDAGHTVAPDVPAEFRPAAQWVGQRDAAVQEIIRTVRAQYQVELR